ncbi:uncharacterized protein proca1 isoform X2 [Austrofundulus limnaeus]|uniref:phospholipase A2 n=1 Tax=Austrofundulus limnaeus TaxID=52670 RepID=A0A2I4CHV0_AUSLI|nr:PREDICTED: protein PROCA1 isoform X2 [Austrofundulus limnaeus]
MGRSSRAAEPAQEELSPSRVVLKVPLRLGMWSVFFVLLSSLDRNAVRGDLLPSRAQEENKEVLSTICAKTSTVGENYLHQVSDGAVVVRSLVSPAGKLVDCSVAVNRTEVSSFVRACSLEERRAARRTPFTHMDEAKETCRELKRRSEGSGSRRHEGEDPTLQEDGVLRRSKRGFTYPGTLWCGAGNMADDYNQLGEFAETDSCCRVHDHCPHVIHAFSSKYGRTNFKWHSISHCDCDNDLKSCLRKVNDTSSRVVGQAFFNVIGVPCFDFAYEEQCAERHWCKRYEKLPVTVLREAVPYDYGGIDVIDELTLAPPRRNDPKEVSEGEPQESVTQSAGEPSLGNVVTAAEDFIKVLATVSTSQSSNADSDKDAAQSSEKKKKKKKKHRRKQKGKGNGRKRKQKAEVKTEEGAAEDVLSLSNFILESNRRNQSNTNVADEFELRRKDEPSNEVMKDEPVPDEESDSVTSPLTGPAGSAESDGKTVKEEENPLLSSRMNATSKNADKRRGRSKKNDKITHHPSSEDPVLNTDGLNGFHSVSPTAKPERRLAKQQLPASTAPIVIPHVKRSRSKESGDKERRKKRKKLSTDSPIVPADLPNSADRLKVIPLSRVPTVPPGLPSDRQHGPHVHGQSSQVSAVPFHVPKGRRAEEIPLRNRRRKTSDPAPSENLLSSHGAAENSVLTTPSPQVPETRRDRQLFTTTVNANPRGRQRKTPLQQTKTSWVTTSVAPSISPLQLSVERAKAQFNKKRRRKALNLNRQ